jgi:hypothetical protein
VRVRLDPAFAREASVTASNPETLAADDEQEPRSRLLLLDEKRK